MFGAICCRLAALPYCCEDPVMNGNIVVQSIKGNGNSVHDCRQPREVFASLLDWKLSLWGSESLKDSARKAYLSIPISRDTCILEENETNITITNECTVWRIIFKPADSSLQVTGNLNLAGLIHLISLFFSRGNG